MAFTGKNTSNSRPRTINVEQVQSKLMHILWIYCEPQKVVKVLERIEIKLKTIRHSLTSYSLHPGEKGKGMKR